MEIKRLCEIGPGQRVVVYAVTTAGSMRRRFLDMGLTEHTAIECVGRSPGGDPSAYLIRGAVLAIRSEDGAGILVTPLPGGHADGID